MPIVITLVSICTRTCTRKSSTRSVYNMNKDVDKLPNPRSPLHIKMAAPTRVVLLACGSFNPITNMHLRMFGKFNYDVVIYEYVRLLCAVFWC